MPSIDINAKVNVSGKPGGSSSSGSSGVTQDQQRTIKLEEAARRALTQRMGKTFTDAQVSQVSRDFAEMSKFSQRLKRFGGDMEKWSSGFSQTFPSQKQSNRHYQDVMQQLGLGGHHTSSGGMFRTAMGGMFRATGMGGGVAGGIMRQGMSQAQESDGGMGSAGGMGMLAKGAGMAALAYGAIKIIQKVSQKVGEAQDQATQYHDLRESLGGTIVGFDELRASVQYFSKGLGTTSSEQVKLAKAYASSSLVFGAGSENAIGQGVAQGTQMSRGYGMSPEAGVDFLATMRHFKASDGEKDNRKLAYLIGEAVGKTGAFSKADDVMNAIAQFTESTSRQSLQTANVEGYAGMLGALGGLKLPGMDAKGAANLMQQVAGSWANGGGEAGASMRLGWAQRSFGATALDMPAIGDAGPLGSAESTWGAGSAKYRLARTDAQREHYAAMAKAGGSSTFIDRELREMQGTVGEKFMGMSLMGKYGVSDIGADALLEAHKQKGGIGGLQSKVAGMLSGTGKDPSKISMSQMGTLAMIDQGDSETLSELRAKARALKGKGSKLTGVEGSELSAAGNDQGKLKQALTRIFALRESEDEGKAARLAAVNLDTQFTAFAAKLIPLTNMIQEGVFKVVDTFSGLSPEMKAFQVSKRYQDKIDSTEDDAAKQAIQDEAMNRARSGPMSPEEWKERRRSIGQSGMGDLEKERLSREQPIPEQIKKLLTKEQDGNRDYIMQRYIDAGYSVEQAAGMTGSLTQESGLNPAAHNRAGGGNGARGIAQWRGSRQKDFENFTGVSIEKSTLQQQMDFELHELEARGEKEKIQKIKTSREAAIFHEQKHEVAKEGAAHDRRIANAAAIEGVWGSDKQIPDTVKAANSGGQSGSVKGQATLSLLYPNGATQEATVPLSGRYGQCHAGNLT